MVIWITGLSASGKTTLGLEMYKLLKNTGAWVFLDGDTIRRVFNEDLGHTVEDRMKNAYRISNLCEMLESQGINVLACVLLISNDVREHNKRHFVEYKEIFIDTSMETLISRDNKFLYKRALDNKEKNVVGVDLKYDYPAHADLILFNNIDGLDFTKKSIEIIHELMLPIDNSYSYTSKNRLKHPEKYEYTQYKGTLFLDAYEQNRKTLLKKLPLVGNDIDIIVKEYNNDSHGTTKILIDMYMFMNHGSIDMQIFKLVQRFEVSKKIFDNYAEETWKRTSEEFSDIKNYLLFGIVLIRAYKLSQNISKKLVLFNALLKLNDLLISINIQNEEEQTLLAYCISEELLIYREVQRND